MHTSVEIKGRQEKPLFKSKESIFQLRYEDEKARESVRKVLSDYKGTRVALSTFNPELENGPVRGSNVYSRFALANAYRKISGEDVRPINSRESEIALANGALVDSGETYEDLGLSFYQKQGSNPILWKHLRDQVKSVLSSINLRKPFVVTGLMDVVKDDNFEYGLRLNINELTEAYNVPALNKAGEFIFSSEDPELQKTGFPSKLGEGNRKLHVGDNGVCWFVRGWNLDLDAWDPVLDDSYVAGRVHLVQNFSDANLDGLVAKLEQEKLRQQKVLDGRYQRAVRVLRGK